VLFYYVTPRCFISNSLFKDIIENIKEVFYIFGSEPNFNNQ